MRVLHGVALYATPMRFTDQDSFVAWCFDEPHAGIHLLSMNPKPGAEVPDRVTLEWGVRAPDDDGPGERFFAWRLTCEGTRVFRLDGAWSPAVPGELRPHDASAPLFLRMDVPGDLVVECNAVTVEALGDRRLELPLVPCQGHLSLESRSDATTVADLLVVLELPPDTAVISFSGRAASPSTPLSELRERSLRAWRVAPSGDCEALALTMAHWPASGYRATLQRRTANDALWARAWALPVNLADITHVRSGNVDTDPAGWAALALETAVPCTEDDPAVHGRALEPDRA